MGFQVVLAPDDVPTEVTIQAPKSAVEGEVFRVRGRLRRMDTRKPLENHLVDVFYDGTYLGSDFTNSRGRFRVDVAIMEPGIFDLVSSFLGAVI